MLFTTTESNPMKKVDLLKALGAGSHRCPTRSSRKIRAVIIPLRKNSPAKFPIPTTQIIRQSHESGRRIPDDGPEIWEDSEVKITHFVCGVGTAGRSVEWANI